MFINRKGTLSLTFVLLFFSINISFADSIVSFADLQYHSGFEKDAFNKLEKSTQPDYFALYLAPDKNVTDKDYESYKKTLDDILIPFNKKSFNKLKEKKKVGKVYNRIHSELLDKYLEDADFATLFSKGEYQCVTASMLYAVVFDKLGIPYEIEFLPGHVYLVAYPNSSKINVETTNPNKGIYIYDKSFKTKYIDYLRKNKLISKDEYNNENIDYLFTEYYLKTEVADKKQLAAAQYSNIAMEALRNNQISESFENMLKAYYLHSNNRNKFLLSITLALQIDKTSASEKIYADYFAMLCQLTAANISRDVLIAGFNSMTKRQLIDEGNVDLYNESYNLIKSKVSDSALLSEFAFTYNAETGNRLLNQSNPLKAQPYIKKAFSIKPGNIKVQLLMVNEIAQQADANKNNIEGLIFMHDSLEKLITDNKDLRTNSRIINIMYRVELNITGFNFYTKKIKEGLIYKNKFEGLADNSNISLDYHSKDGVERAYSTIAAYYFKIGNYKKARGAIKKGLGYCPDSYSLKRRLKALN